MNHYFNNLNYTLANEDTKVEYDLINSNTKSIAVICGSGSRALPLMAKQIDYLKIIDLSQAQLELCQIRLAAIKNLTYHQFLYLMGYQKSASGLETREDLISKLKLKPETQKILKDNVELWRDCGFIYLGKWENHFMKMGSVFKKFLNPHLDKIFLAQDLEEQKKLVSKYWNRTAFKLYLKVVLNSYVINKMLYKGSFAGGKKDTKNILCASNFVSKSFNSLFDETLVSKNYFLQMIFLQKIINRDAYPLEAQEEVFHLMKSSQTKVEFFCGTFSQAVSKQLFDLYSPSDITSYMSSEDLNDLIHQHISSNIKKETLFVMRNFIRKPDFDLKDKWINDKVFNQKLEKKDCTRMYEIDLLTSK